jgi:GT2 family glycosyltransferase
MNIIAVVVLYNCPSGNSKTIKSLISAYHSDMESFSGFRLIIYDNGIIDQSKNIDLPFRFEYFQNKRNEGLAKAYNYAITQAHIYSCDWLLLLDQDSELPLSFVSDINKGIECMDMSAGIIAVVPKMCFENSFFSPSRVLFGGIHRPIDMKFTGIYPGNIFAIGSGTIVNVPFLNKIGGFNEFFWMDCLDRWLYMSIYRSGGKVLVTDIIIKHELSVMDYNQFMTEKRYLNILFYETCFMSFHMSRAENLFYYIRLLRRSIFMFFQGTTRCYSKMTLNHLLDILLKRDKDLERAKETYFAK